jgi:uncharacterized repeat protein (TIGR03803 family)
MAAAIVALVVFGTATRAFSQTETILLAFYATGSNGDEPDAGLISDASGSLYGTTAQTAGSVGGTVFQLAPVAGGGWSERILYRFILDGIDGTGPQAALTLDSSGNLYGTTAYGGTGTNCSVYGCGTIFKLTPTGGTWTEEILHNFSGAGTDGWQPTSNLIFDSAGNLYGTTTGGGAYGSGTVFEFMPTPGSGWREKILHNFSGNGTGGATPLAGLIFDAAGNLFGTTANGGAHGFYNAGTVFELTPTAGGKWTETPIHQFGKGSDGQTPNAGLIFDSAGNLYGTTYEGGPYHRGIVFELTPKIGGGWVEKAIHAFGGVNEDGTNPTAALILDTQGNLYGTTIIGGTQSIGIAFELSPNARGGWTETILHSFSYNDPSDGLYPSAGLIFDAVGNLYGTTRSGGTNGGGTVFEISP